VKGGFIVIEPQLKRRIVKLPRSVADRIAAGEVVERPAAVVKELVENALDAAATRITVVIKDAGRTLIQVVDDGCGMTGDELELAVGRHATSKLNRIEDLEHLNTFGFRGEALPSMAAVSRMEIVSRPRDAEVGAMLKIAGGTVEHCAPAAAQPGTTVSVSHLFYNVPARRKFLRSDSTEFRWIALTFRQFALVFPEVAWELFRDGEPVYQLPPASPLERIAGIFGDDVAEDLIGIDHQRAWLKVTGFISPPSLTQRHKSDQYLFLNRRPIVSARLSRAVYNACEKYLVAGGHPIYIVQLHAPPDRFDINVHPAKREVKFSDESGASSGVWAAVRSAIAGSRTPEELSPGVAAAGRPPDVGKPAAGTGKMNAVFARRAVVDSPSHLTPFIPVHERRRSPGDALPFPPVEGVSPGPSEIPAPGAAQPHLGRGEDADARVARPVIWQIFNTYIVSPLKTGLVFIDQHIAHERVLFERALRAMEAKPWTSQQLLFPATITVHPEDVAVIEELLPLLQAMGFAIEAFGPREFRIIAAPAGLRMTDEGDTLLEIVHDFKETGAAGGDPRQRLAAAFACKVAVKAGESLQPEEMQQLIEELFQTEDPEFCPHGRPIYHVLSRREIEKWFKR